MFLNLFLMKKYFFLLLLFSTLISFSQAGINTAFSFVNMQTSPRSIAMGGMLVSIIDDDVSLAQHSPSLINSEMHRRLAFNIIDYFADLSSFSVHYAHHFEKFGLFYQMY